MRMNKNFLLILAGFACAGLIAFSNHPAIAEEGGVVGAVAVDAVQGSCYVYHNNTGELECGDNLTRSGCDAYNVREQQGSPSRGFWDPYGSCSDLNYNNDPDPSSSLLFSYEVSEKSSNFTCSSLPEGLLGFSTARINAYNQSLAEIEQLNTNVYTPQNNSNNALLKKVPTANCFEEFSLDGTGGTCSVDCGMLGIYAVNVSPSPSPTPDPSESPSPSPSSTPEPSPSPSPTPTPS